MKKNEVKLTKEYPNKATSYYMKGKEVEILLFDKSASSIKKTQKINIIN